MNTGKGKLPSGDVLNKVVTWRGSCYKGMSSGVLVSCQKSKSRGFCFSDAKIGRKSGDRATALSILLGCPLKTSFWRAGQVAMGLDVSQPEAIWSHLTFSQHTNKDTLVALGRILQTVWRMNWTCVIDNEPWNNIHAMTRLHKMVWQTGLSDQQDN
ncbi:unnamed protein product [Absidia cylindrospora]